LLAPWHQLKRVLHLERIRLPAGISTSQFLLSLIVPGFAFGTLGRAVLGRMVFTGYCLAVIVCTAALGYTVGSIAFGLMIAAHATSIVYLEGRWLAGSEFRTRFGATLATLIAVWAFVYYPFIRVVENHWLTPMQVGGNVVIVWRGGGPTCVQRGDWIAWRIEYRGEEQVYLRAGLGIDPVLAVAGDRVEFTQDAVLVNGKPVPRAPHMPTSGGFVVQEKTWFVWPRLDTMQHGGVREAAISTVLQQAAMVSETQLVGKPLKSWFGRRQIL